MNNEELVIEMKKIRRNLENAKQQLRKVETLLNESISFNNKGFKEEEIETIKAKIDSRIYYLNNKIIPGLNNM